MPDNDREYGHKAGSNSVRNVESVTATNNAHGIPTHGEPNSVSRKFKNGELSSERYYDENGDA